MTEQLEEKPKYITEAQLEEFVKVARERFARMQKDIEALQLRGEESPDVKPKYIHCSEEGCPYQTDDLGAFVTHAVDERMRKLSPPKGHRTVEELLACPECMSKLEIALTERGFVKEEKTPEGDVCPKHGTELVKPLVGEPFCPKCRREKGLLF